MGSYPPRDHKQMLRLLNKLGFVRHQRVGKGKHIKFEHPTLQPPSGIRPFITVPTNMHQVMSKLIIKEIMKFGIPEDEIKEKC